MSNDDRESAAQAGPQGPTEGSTVAWTDEDMAKVAAEELATALRKQRIGFADVVDDDDRVVIDFHDISEADVMLTLLFRQPGSVGTLYDRATNNCVTINSLHDTYGSAVPEGVMHDAFTSGWHWDVHPAMTESRTIGWHVGLRMTSDDAMEVAAALNSGAAL